MTNATDAVIATNTGEPWAHTQSQPQQLADGSPVPDLLAHKLAGHYARTPRGGLARIYWTGRATPEAIRELEITLRGDDFPPVKDSRDRNDPQAMVSECRALIAWIEKRIKLGVPQPDVWPPEYDSDIPMIVPWGWTAEGRS